MTYDQTTADLHAPDTLPEVRKITFADLRDALSKGFDDFRHRPSHVFFLGIMYPVLGLILGRLAFGYDVLPLLFPLAAGFALLGPIAAIGFYDLSRRRERGEDASWWKVFQLRRAKSFGAILTLGALLMVVFFVWVWAAGEIYADLFGGVKPKSISDFLNQVFYTENGRRLMVVGNAVGFLFALVSFATSVISFPLLVDRDVSAPVAIVTSLKAIAKNPVTMGVWAIFITAAMVLGSLPFLLGLVVVLPVLGHASWHVYRKVVV